MLRTILINLRNWTRWLRSLAGQSEHTVAVLTPPPVIIGERLFLFATQRALHRPSRRFVTVKIAQPAEYRTFRSIFADEDYNLALIGRWTDVKAGYDRIIADGRTPLIVDCGANIGLSAVYFALAYPDARIIAVEPQPDNFRRAVAATAAFPHVKVIHAGVASASGSARITDPNLGNDAYRTELSTSGEVRLCTVPEIIREAGATVPFVIKIDIEGFESNLFARDTGWIDDFEVMIIELHDWLLPGECNSENFLRAISQHHRDFVYMGENIFSLKTN